MKFVYVIESLTDQTRYTGIAIDPALRLIDHNSGKNRFTKGHLPWKIIYSEQHSGWVAARKKEKYFKSAAGKKWLKININPPGGDTGSPPA